VSLPCCHEINFQPCAALSAAKKLPVRMSKCQKLCHRQELNYVKPGIKIKLKYSQVVDMALYVLRLEGG